MKTNDAATTELRTILVERQLQAGLTSSAFARKLGLDRAHWYRISSGEYGVSLAVLKKAVDAYPDLAERLRSLFYPERV